MPIILPPWKGAYAYLDWISQTIATGGVVKHIAFDTFSTTNPTVFSTDTNSPGDTHLTITPPHHAYIMFQLDNAWVPAGGDSTYRRSCILNTTTPPLFGAFAARTGANSYDNTVADIGIANTSSTTVMAFLQAFQTGVFRIDITQFSGSDTDVTGILQVATMRTPVIGTVY